tara:strand:- start:573 stop:1295 length:723 start_codon:yes stop_codon:yes gene_type:complete
MGSMTLTQLRESVKFHAQNSRNATDALLDRAINSTYLHVTQPHIYQHRRMKAKVALPLVLNTDIYALDSTTVATYQGTNTQSNQFLAWTTAIFWDTATYPFPTSTRRKKLVPISDDDMDRSSLKTGSEPSSYIVDGERFEINVYPPSGDVGKFIELRGYVQPALLTTTSSTLNLDEMWDDIIIVGAAWRMSRALGEFNRSAEFRAEFGQLIAEAVNYDMVEGENDDIAFSVAVDDNMRSM